jgi:hypothetical protein
MASYLITDFLDKTLYAVKQVPIRRYPEDKEKPIYIVKSGEMVGVVYSWIGIKANVRKSNYFMFYDANGRAYYTPAILSMYSMTHAKEQGIKTTEQKIKEQEEKEDKDKEGVYYYITKYGKWVLAAYVVAKIFPFVLPEIKNVFKKN